jgi:hypothetical protein
MAIIDEDAAKAKQEKKFKKLDLDWRQEQMSKKSDVIKQLIADTAISLVVLALLKEGDEDIASLRQKLATANKYYTEGKKRKNIEVEFLIECLRSQGIPVEGLDDIVADAKKKARAGGLDEEVKKAAQRLKNAAGPGGSVTVTGPRGSVTVVNPPK